MNLIYFLYSSKDCTCVLSKYYFLYLSKTLYFLNIILFRVHWNRTKGKLTIFIDYEVFLNSLLSCWYARTPTSPHSFSGEKKINFEFNTRKTIQELNSSSNHTNKYNERWREFLLLIFLSFIHSFTILAFEVSRFVAAKCDRRKAPIHVHVLRWDRLFNSKEMWLYDGKYFSFHSVVLAYLCVVFTCVQIIHIYILLILIVSMREKLWSFVVCGMVYQESYAAHRHSQTALSYSFPAYKRLKLKMFSAEEEHPCDHSQMRTRDRTTTHHRKQNSSEMKIKKRNNELMIIQIVRAYVY